MDQNKFNPELTKWLNDLDYVSGDWPENVPANLRIKADHEIGRGYLLDALGWPTPIFAPDATFYFF